jgi:hypothetical protein
MIVIVIAKANESSTTMQMAAVRRRLFPKHNDSERRGREKGAQSTVDSY